MKSTFYIRLFLTFIIFAVVLLVFSFVSFDSFYKSSIKQKDVENITKAFHHQNHMIDTYVMNVNKELEAFNSSDVFIEYLRTKENKNLLSLMKIFMSSNKDILQFKYVDLKGNEKFKLLNENKKLKVSNKDDLENLATTSFFKNIRALKANQIYNSSLSIYKEKAEIKFPVKHVIEFAIKTKEGFLVLILDVKKILSTLQHSFGKFTYIIDNKGYFIVHKDSKYNWSKYFSSNETLYKLYPKDSSDILNSHEVITDEFISKRLYLNPYKYVTVLIEFDNKILEKEVKEFETYFNSIVIVGILFAIFLALLFSEPLAKLNKKALDKNKDLDLSVKQSSQELNESQLIIDKYVITLRLDRNGIITDVSSAFCDVSGFAKGELIGHHHKMLMYPDFNEKEYEELWKYLQAGNSYSLEMKALKKDGSYYWAESFIEPIFNEFNELIGFTVIRNNITDKKTIQNLYNDINNQVGQYNAIFENANSGIALVDLGGNFKKTNNTLMELLGYSNKELLEIGCFDIILDSSKEILQKIFFEAKQIGLIRSIEKIFIHKDGTQIHLELSLNLLPDKKHFVLVLNPLEDKRKLQELNQNLSAKIQEEVEKSRQKDKIHQEEQIQNAKLSSIGSLAAGITHEINTPLTYIKGNFEMMGYDIEDLPESEIRTRMLEDSVKINDGLNRIANIVESMREISQSSKETKENLNIYSTLITSLTMAYNRSKQVSKIYLNNKIFTIDNINKNEFEFMCNVQKQRIEQVWIIIINNALDELVKIDDYEKRSLSINIEENEENIIVSFKDNAGGINNDIINNIFDPFVSSKEHSGMGVGLNIAKKIIEQQDGKIIAYNENEGAVFQVELKKNN